MTDVAERVSRQWLAPGAGPRRPALAAVALALLCSAAPARAGAAARLDPALAGGGVLFTAAHPTSPAPRGARVAEDSGGRLIALTSAADELVVARYLPGGRLDPGFGTAGVAYVQLSSGAPERHDDEAVAGALAIQPDGRILVGGSYDPDIVIEGGSGSSELALARLLPNGRPDPSFGGNARLEAPPGGVLERRGTNVRALALQGGRILAGGEAEAGAAYVARYTAAGTLDRSFGRGTGMAHFRRGRAGGAVTGLLAPRRGGVYAAGYLGGNFLLARLGPDGVPDRRFGRAGRVVTGVARRHGCGCSIGEGLARDRRGRLLVSGTLLARRPGGYLDPESVAGARAIALARYTPGGALDRTFGRQGIVRTRLGDSAHGRGIALQRDGRIVVAGSTTGHAGHSRFTVVRYLPDGRLDRSFFGDGAFTRSLGAVASAAWDPIVDRAGRLVVAGSATFGGGATKSASGILLARFLPGH